MKNVAIYLRVSTSRQDTENQRRELEAVAARSGWRVVKASRSIRQAEVGAARTMIERTEERFGLKPERLVGDTAYGAAPMLNWLVERRASRLIFPCSTNRSGMTVHSRAATFDMIRPTTSTTARAVSGSERAAPCTRARPCYIAPASSTAMYAHSNPSAAQSSHPARSRAISMSMPEMSPGRSLAPRDLRSLSVSARRSRCGSRTSSAS
jgi:Resolvase, N terminal domain